MPRSHHQKYFVVARVLRLDRFVHRNRAIDIFLVPEAMDQHHRHLQRFFREQLIDRLLLPERIVSRMLDQLPPESGLLQSALPAQQREANRERYEPRPSAEDPNEIQPSFCPVKAVSSLD
jgi:hypothetical protein